MSTALTHPAILMPEAADWYFRNSCLLTGGEFSSVAFTRSSTALVFSL